MRATFTWLTGLFLGVLISAGCSRTTTSTESGSSPQTEERDKPEKPAHADKADKEDMAALVRGTNELTFDLFRRLDEKGNLVASPFSVAVALSMTFANADNDALSNALHVPFTQDRLNTTFAGLLWQLQREGEPQPYDLSIASSLWLAKSRYFKPSEEYVKKTRDNYAAEPHLVSFRDGGVAAINEWCDRKTHHKIKEILTDDDVDSLTTAVLVNAIYFKGPWLYEFYKDQTRRGTFDVSRDRTVTAQFMHQLTDVRYFESRDVQVVELPFRGEMSMWLVLPTQRHGIADLVRTLTIDRFERWNSSMRKTDVDVLLPRFKIEGNRVELLATIEALGVRVQEVPRIGAMEPGRKPKINFVYHRGSVEVNEEGASAAAISGVGRDKGSTPSTRTKFRADHPFLFLIRDNRTGCVLFIGRVEEPTN